MNEEIIGKEKRAYLILNAYMNTLNPSIKHKSLIGIIYRFAKKSLDGEIMGFITDDISSINNMNAFLREALQCIYLLDMTPERMIIVISKLEEHWKVKWKI